VRLQRIRPFVGNAYKPVFVGEFREHSGGVVLEGRFAITRETRLFMTVWLGFAVFMSAYSVFLGLFVAMADGNWSAFLGVPAGVAFFAIGVGLLRSGWWWAREDIAVISSVINKALRRKWGEPD
jgi:hypothetical protein